MRGLGLGQMMGGARNGGGGGNSGPKINLI
jgi:hypothetical protein